MARITYRIEGLDEVVRRVGALGRVRNREILRIATGAHYTGALLRFREGRAPDDSPWAARKSNFNRRGDHPLLRLSGRLRNSLSQSVDDTEGRIGTNVRYAAIHQFGGVIVPNKGRALAIPLTREAEAAGRARNFPRPLALVWEKGSDHGFLVEEQGGRAKKGFRARTILHYLLVRKVTMPARPYLGSSARDREETATRLQTYLARQAGGR